MCDPKIFEAVFSGFCLNQDFQNERISRIGSLRLYIPFHWHTTSYPGHPFILKILVQTKADGTRRVPATMS